MRVLREYSIDCRYAARTLARSRSTTSGESPPAGMPANTEPSPRLFQSMRWGRGAQGPWLDRRAISAITGARFGVARSERWKTDRVYWSGIEEKLKAGPRYPRSGAV